MVIDSASFNPKYPPKSVIEQNPAAGDFVKENRKIYLTLNPSDFRKISVPNVIDNTKRQVVTQLKSSRISDREGALHPGSWKGRCAEALEVNGKKIEPGVQPAQKYSTIDLVLGDGLEEREDSSSRCMIGHERTRCQ